MSLAEDARALVDQAIDLWYARPEQSLTILDDELPGGDPRRIFLRVVGQLAVDGDPSDELIGEVEAEITRRARRVVQRLSGR